MQIGPVRWIFIKSPTVRRPYTNIRKIYNIELANSKAKHLSGLQQQELLAIREKTKKILQQKKRKEVFQNLFAFLIILIIAIFFVAFLM